MSTSSTLRRFFIYITTLTLLLSVLGVLVLQNLQPERYFKAYPLIPAYFYGYGLLAANVLATCRRQAPKRFTMMYLTLKVLKILLSILLMVLYALLAPHSAVEFMLTCVVFYFCYLIFESWFFVSEETKEKKKKR